MCYFIDGDHQASYDQFNGKLIRPLLYIYVEKRIVAGVQITETTVLKRELPASAAQGCKAVQIQIQHFIEFERKGIDSFGINTQMGISITDQMLILLT